MTDRATPERAAKGAPFDDLYDRAALARPVDQAALSLLGAILVHRTPAGFVAGRIVETEAYGASDPASHSFFGPTPRNAPMFGPAGHLYVYRSYGLHLCLNVTTGALGAGEAVLVRALEPLVGLAIMKRNRLAAAIYVRRPPVRPWPEPALCRGPGNLARALGVDLAQSGTDLLNDCAEVTLHRGAPVPPDQVACGPRIGISRAQDVPWRFWQREHPAVSR